MNAKIQIEIGKVYDYRPAPGQPGLSVSEVPTLYALAVATKTVKTDPNSVHHGHTLAVEKRAGDILFTPNDKGLNGDWRAYYAPEGGDA